MLPISVAAMAQTGKVASKILPSTCTPLRCVCSNAKIPAITNPKTDKTKTRFAALGATPIKWSAIVA